MTDKMPEFTPRLSAVSRDRYKIKFLEDGYPGKEIGNETHCHPIYGVYVIRDYLFQYRKTKEMKYQDAAIKVANAAIHRMETFRNALVFWYKKDSPFNSTSKEYYSGLTQSYYAEIFAQVYKLTNISIYKDAAKKVYASLKIPVSLGGVFHNSSKGPSIQEYPMSPNGYVLNGWLSTISAIKNYADILQDAEAENFWTDNLLTLSKLLPLYDAPYFLNSRYTLNGMTTVKLFSPSTQFELQRVNLIVPDEDNYELKIDSKRRYANFIEGSSVLQKNGKILTRKNTALLKVLLSRFSYPKENELSIKLFSPHTAKIQIFIAQPQYFPTKIIEPQKSASYHLIKEVSLQKGLNDIKVKLPWEPLDAIGIPTTFKQFGSKWHNVYHFIHIDKLNYFYGITNNKQLLDYSTKWKKYTDSWINNPLYDGLEKSPYQGG
ncbi:D-glucuronyl C5-epimerase family protein [Priestia megaterium]|uniref:D-glucuronyl C5-epimerase family protein n=1 Tax=Priestia megaterium TaxID=1404 RepID=UPI003D01F805